LWDALPPHGSPGGTCIRAPTGIPTTSVRIAGRTPWGSEIVLAAFTTVGHGRPNSVPEMLGVLVSGELGARAPASSIRRLGDVAYFEIRRGAVRIVLVVPDGVTRIAYHLSCGPTIKADVHHNTTAFVIRPVPAAPGLIAIASTMTWYGPTGLIVKRVPSQLSVVKRVIGHHGACRHPAVTMGTL
jgi:hypothetical protein